MHLISEFSHFKSRAGHLPLVGLLALLLVAHARYRFAFVQGESMLPSLASGDLLIVDKTAYRAADPARGDVVVALSGRDLIVKRVVGLPGEQLELKAGHMFVNGLPVAERYPLQSGLLYIAPGKLRTGRFAVIGDNRTLAPTQVASCVVTRECIVGKVLRTVPFSRLFCGKPTESSQLSSSQSAAKPPPGRG
ncbi:MAG: signal peptidase I [Verrucomicrobiota bacterium]